MPAKIRKSKLVEKTGDSGLGNHGKAEKTEENNSYKMQLVWKNIIFLCYMHLGALYGIYLIFTSAKLATTIFALILSYLSGFGITSGVHRLWSHRSYKAKWPLRLLLTFLNTIAFQASVIEWSRDHRMHHRYSDTNADPYNARRGFFFSHVGWLMCRKHPDVREKGKGIDVSDLYADPILLIQHKYYVPLGLLCSFVLPTVIPVYCWNESWINAFFIATSLRWVHLNNLSWLVNSLAHTIGNKPYDKNIYPSQNKLLFYTAYGEGWHNYHHTFPWDYKAEELGNCFPNITTAFIEFFAWIGWAYDLKTVSEEMIKARVQRTGDGSHQLWGWGDKNLTKEDREATVIYK